ncbi:MAG: radical SAM protein [Phycisphaerae bacterium]|nr:radical SAM protein [Phycisphaerae bacterium]
MRRFMMDGHKLMYHPDRVAEFMETGDCFPLYVEISPVGSCNHRCLFCAYDYIGHPNRRLDGNRTLTLIDELAECGVRSILFAGEGEPLLHPDLGRMVGRCRERGIDAGLFTNGQLLSEELAETILPSLLFVRFSFNGGSAENYAAIHQVSTRVFNQVVGRIEQAVQIRERQKLNVDLGAQFVLLPENLDFVFEAASRLKSAGIDYFVVKPFVQQSEQQGYQLKEPLPLLRLESVFSRLEELNDRDFSVVIRRNAFEGYGQRNYSHCLGTSFITAINSGGDVASCLPYWDRPEFVYGNIQNTSFTEIWHGENRKRIKQHIEEELEVCRVCPPNCRPHAINEYLSEIRWPTAKHVNFV